MGIIDFFTCSFNCWKNPRWHEVSGKVSGENQQIEVPYQD
jgi:hypothetical protein